MITRSERQKVERQPENFTTEVRRRRSDAMQRFAAILPVLDFLFDKPRLQLRPSTRHSRRLLGSIIEQCAAENAVSAKTMRRYVRSFRERGYAGLLHTRADFGISRFFKNDPEAAAIALRLFSSHASGREVWKRLRAYYGQDAPGYDAVLRFLRQLRSAERKQKGR